MEHLTGKLYIRLITVLLALSAGMAGIGCNEFMIRWSSEAPASAVDLSSRSSRPENRKEEPKPRADDYTPQPKSVSPHFNENGNLKDLAVASSDDMNILVGGSMCRKPFSKYIFLKNGEMTIYRLNNKDTGKGRLVEGKETLEFELPLSGAGNSGKVTITTVPYCGGDTAGGMLLPGIFTPIELLPEDLPAGVIVETTRAGTFIYRFINEISDKSKVVIYMRLHEKFSNAKVAGYFRTVPELRTIIEGLGSASLTTKKNYVLRVADSDEFAVVFIAKDRRKNE